MARRSSGNTATATALVPQVRQAYAMTKLGEVLEQANWLKDFRARKGLSALPPRCEDCRSTGYIESEYCSCGWGARRKKQDDAQLAQIHEAADLDEEAKLKAILNLPQRHAAWSLDSHPLAGTTTHQAILAWRDSWDGQQSLLLCGPVGTGKTGYLVGLLDSMRKRARKSGWRMRFMTAPEMFGNLQAGFADHSSDGLVHEYSTVQVLGLDDLGADRVTDWRREALFTILNARHENSLPLLATTNMDLAALQKYLGVRVYSRLLQNCMVLDVLGDDLRKPETPEHAAWYTEY